MCLDKVDVKPTISGKGKGWKVFHQWVERELSPLFFSHLHELFEIGEWVEDTNQNDGLGYPVGFHLFANEEDAMRYATRHHYWVVYCVEFDEVVTTGWQQNAKVIVARKVKVLPNE